ncbi:hypothetical protein BDN70DRAFT_892228 [Pholiota conissans]|uniref:Uncharacterized protein n=1 Tax=Pholiota conissans TaxID=109636 RepID=A0A9P5Z955_9AGAR|nr:hypothetical protein BDN70DRAFT_892228 [Pholiota conissans]
MAPIRRAVPGGILQAKDRRATTSSSVVTNSLKPAAVGSVKDSFKVSKPREENYIPKYDLWAPEEETAPTDLMEGDKALLRDYEEGAEHLCLHDAASILTQLLDFSTEFNTSQLSSPIVSEEEGSDQMRRGSEMDSFNDDIEIGTSDLSEGLEEETASIALTEGDNASVSLESAEVQSSHHGEESYTSQQSSLIISEEAAFARVGIAGHPTDDNSVTAQSSGGNNTAVDNISSESNVNSEIKSVNSEEGE